MDKTVSRAEKRRLLAEACEHHQVMYKDAMNGKAIDRHLFALYVASRGMGLVSLSVCLCDIRVSGGWVEGFYECMCVLPVSRDI